MFIFRSTGKAWYSWVVLNHDVWILLLAARNDTCWECSVIILLLAMRSGIGRGLFIMGDNELKITILSLNLFTWPFVIPLL